MARRMITLLALACALVLVASACDNSTDGTTTTSGSTSGSTLPGESTTTVAPSTTVPAGSIPGESSDSIPDDVADQIRSEIGEVMLQVEESRALPFLEIPTVTILDEEEFTARVNATLQEDLDQEETEGLEAMFQLLGMLDESVDLYQLQVDLYTEQVAGFYDGEADELVVPVAVDGITPLQEIVIAHELVHALTDQHFDAIDEYSTTVEEGVGDDASAVLALIEGDATYQQFLYLESFDPAQAAAAALEALTIDTTVLDSAPEWIQRDLSFPYEQGLVFAGALIADGGLKRIDEAYQAPPVSTEQILDPNKFLRGELPDPIEPLTVDLAGWELFDEATFGEWGVRLLLMETLSPGNLVQVAAGWGNDTYRTFLNGPETAFVWSYLAETEEDAEELTNALIAHSRDAMGASAAEESGGGLLFAGGDPYVFIDRIENQIFYVASTDAVAGDDLRTQLGL
ncbi:MAG: hypothetical protein ACR2N2_08830 [Acidimicrobiia bacterium]